jgi:hypothetical protein
MAAVGRHRPVGITVLAVLAVVAALVAAWHTLQYLHVIPFTIGELQFYGFDPLGAILWAVTTLIWIWAALNLWNLRRDALTFITILAGWNVILALISWLGASSFQAILPQLALSLLILIYAFTPQVREAFGVL